MIFFMHACEYNKFEKTEYEFMIELLYCLSISKLGLLFKVFFVSIYMNFSIGKNYECVCVFVFLNVKNVVEIFGIYENMESYVEKQNFASNFKNYTLPKNSPFF